MGYSNYLYLKDENIAIEVGKISDYNDDICDILEEISMYKEMEKEELQVLNYIINKIMYNEPKEILTGLMAKFYGGELIHEDKLGRLKGVKIVNIK